MGGGALGDSWAFNCLEFLGLPIRQWGDPLAGLRICMGASGFPAALQLFLVSIPIHRGRGESQKVWQQAPQLYSWHWQYSWLILPFVSPNSTCTNGCNRVYPLKYLGPFKESPPFCPYNPVHGITQGVPLLAKKGIISRSGHLGPSLDKILFSGKEIPHNDSELVGSGQAERNTQSSNIEEVLCSRYHIVPHGGKQGRTGCHTRRPRLFTSGHWEALAQNHRVPT